MTSLVLILGEHSILIFIRDLRVNIIQILSRRDLLGSVLIHREEYEDGMSSDAIEGEPSHLEAIPILSPSMPTLDVLTKPILDPNNLSYALKSHDDPRNPLRHAEHRNHES